MNVKLTEKSTNTLCEDVKTGRGGDLVVSSTLKIRMCGDKDVWMNAFYAMCQAPIIGKATTYNSLMDTIHTFDDKPLLQKEMRGMLTGAKLDITYELKKMW